MNISAWAIRNPVPSILLFVILTALGIFGFQRLSVQNYPDMEFPTVTVSASLEGGAPSQLETEVARVLEDRIATLVGVEHINTTITDGSVLMRVQFVLEKDSEEALNEVRGAVDSARGDLPPDMRPPLVTKRTTSGGPIVTYLVAAEHLSEESLSWFVDNEITRAMRATPGVGEINRIGGVDREILVELDPAALNGLGISPATISAQLTAVQRDFSGGEGRVAGANQSVRILGAVNQASEIAGLPIPLGDGRHVRLDQVATISDTHAERSSYALWNGEPVIAFQIIRSRGASEISTLEAVEATVEKLKKQYPSISITQAYTTIGPVKENYQSSMRLLYEGAVLAVLVVFWFLRDWRATFVSAAALPLSIIPTFGLMYFFGFSLNTVTLLALSLVIGILVDDAIVEVENIVRHLRMGKKPIDAATDAAREIGLAVIATTLTLVAVFLPTAFMGGVPGKFFRQFGLTASVAVLVSLMVARLLTPMMAAYMLKADDSQERDGPLMRRYLKVARWCQAHRKTTAAAAVAFFIGSLALVPMLPTGFVPAGDQSQTRVSLELAPGSRLDDAQEVTQRALALLAGVDDVKSSFAAITSPTGATIALNLTPRSERDYRQSVIEREIRQVLAPLPGVRVSVGGGNTGEVLEIGLASDDPDALALASRAVERDLRTLPGIGSVTSGAALQRPEIQITPDYDRAADLGVTSAALARAVRIATYGDYSAGLGKLNLPQRQVDVRVRLADDVRFDLDAIRQLRVPTAYGSVPLHAVADVRLGSGPSQIIRRDRQRITTISVELGGRSIGEVIAETHQLPSLQSLPNGVSRVTGGDAKRMAELFGSFGMAMAIGVVCIYAVLVLLFHDFLQPVTILAALPLSVGGAMLALLMTNNSLSMPSIIGLLMLMGIVTKNSILLVDYTITGRRERGLSRLDALIDACHKRARPIIMTTIAMVAGMLPIALGIGADSSFRSPMAIVVIGGLVTSTFLSLLIVPVVFSYIDDMLLFLRRMIGNLRDESY